MPWDLIRWAADLHREAIKCKACGGLPFGSTLVGDPCTCPVPQPGDAGYPLPDSDTCVGTRYHPAPPVADSWQPDDAGFSLPDVDDEC